MDKEDDKGDKEEAKEAAPTEAPTESDAPHSPSEEPTQATAEVVSEPTESPTRRRRHQPSQAPTLAPADETSGSVPTFVRTDDEVKEVSKGSETDQEREEKITEQEEMDQIEMAKNLGALLGGLAVVYYLYTLLKRACTWCFSLCGEPEAGDDTQGGAGSPTYTPVSLIGDLIDDTDHGVAMNPISSTSRSNSSSTRASNSASTTRNDGWGEHQEEDDELNAAIAMSLSESQQPRTSPAHSVGSATMQAATGEDDDAWDDDFDIDSGEDEGESQVQPLVSSKQQLAPSHGMPDENLLGAVMSGASYTVPARASSQQGSIGHGGSGRFKTSTQAPLGTTSAAGVKVVKGQSLKDAFGKR